MVGSEHGGTGSVAVMTTLLVSSALIGSRRVAGKPVEWRRH
jgi:hypothetical protein